MKQITTDDLTGAMMLLASARTIIGETDEKFFGELDPVKDTLAIACDFPRARNKVFAVEELLRQVERELADLGASTGYPGTETDEAEGRS